MNARILNGKYEVTLPKWQFVITCGLMIVLSTAAMIGAVFIFAVANGYAVAVEQEPATVEAPSAQQEPATVEAPSAQQEPATVEAPSAQQDDVAVMAEEAEKVLADSGIIAGKGSIERIYATAPNKLTIVTSYTENTPEEKVHAIAIAAWGAGLGGVEGVGTVEVAASDDSPLFTLDKGQR